nr:MAG TPA: hypothetical protein [Caudoviricetes sp.]
MLTTLLFEYITVCYESQQQNDKKRKKCYEKY